MVSVVLDSKERQVVHLDEKESSEGMMKHGDPQGSILGPLFFILYIHQRSATVCQTRGMPDIIPSALLISV